MKLRAAIILVVLIAGAALWLIGTRRTKTVPESTADATSPSKSAVRHHAAPVASVPEGNPEVPEEHPDLNPALAGPVVSQPKRAPLAALEEPPTAPDLDETRPVLAPAIALENMRTVFRQYALRFGGNPVGNNREITAALNGQNPRQVVFLNPDDGLPINPRGELVDNWGTPYFFHQLSGSEMEIHSAGPDRKMWTADDLVAK